MQHPVVIFKGTAHLMSPETGQKIATVTETCATDTVAAIKVALHPPLSIAGTENLALYMARNDKALISINATGGAATTLREFDGKSSAGCVPHGSKLSLVKSPGGPLTTLLVVLGEGTLGRD